MISGSGFYIFGDIIKNLSIMLLKIAKHEELTKEEINLLETYTEELYMAHTASDTIEEINDDLYDSYERRSDR